MQYLFKFCVLIYRFNLKGMISVKIKRLFVFLLILGIFLGSAGCGSIPKALASKLGNSIDLVTTSVTVYDTCTGESWSITDDAMIEKLRKVTDVSEWKSLSGLGDQISAVANYVVDLENGTCIGLLGDGYVQVGTSFEYISEDSFRIVDSCQYQVPTEFTDLLEEMTVSPELSAQGEQRDLEDSVDASEVLSDVNIAVMIGELTYNPSVLEEAVGAHDYVFSGVVTEVVGTEYPYRHTYTFDSGEEAVVDGPQYTRFQVEITENIKGDLTVGDTMDARKLGGYDAEDGIYYMCEGDTLPQAGHEYLFLAVSVRDGIIRIASPESTIPLDAGGDAISIYNVEAVPDRQAIMDRYMEAYQNEIPCEE